jgi:tRNA nucleotidyltransferase (CCA-adding enzyme)
MNAVALSPDGLTVDPFGGLEDIRAGIVRCVGDPAQRFEEDALRMFRALRFAARLGFTIDIDTYSAIAEKAPLASSLAAERVRDELEKTLLTNHTERIGEMISLGLLDRYIHRPEGEVPWLSILSGLQKKALPRWAVFSVILLQNGLIGSVRDFLTALRLDGRTIRCCANAAAIVAASPPEDKLGWKRLLNKYGVDSAACAAAAFTALGSDEPEKQFISVLKSGECFSMRRLAVTGDDLLELGFRGPQLGETMRFLLDYVMEHPEFNRRELLLSLVGDGEES